MLAGICNRWSELKIMYRVIAMVLLGALLGTVLPGLPFLPLLGSVFVSALKAVAPFLIFFLILASLSKSSKNLGPQFRTVILLYIAATVISAVLSIVVNFLFPVRLSLHSSGHDEPVSDIVELLSNIILSMFDNPVSALASGNFLSIIFWSVFGGLIIHRYASDATKDVIDDLSNIVSKIITIIINCAPFGILGLVYSSVSENSISVFGQYAMLIAVLAVTIGTVMFVTNPLMFYLTTRRNPYPLLFRCLKDSGVTAFFTRSSAANIPVNMKLAEELGLDMEFCSVSIPLGATINTCGAAITISTMALAAAFSLGIQVSLPMAVVLCIVSSLAACGASGVTGGSLLLIPMACSLFGISYDVSMQVVAIGFVISVIQDSMETALNSSSDVYFSAAADMRVRPDGDFRI